MNWKNLSPSITRQRVIIEASTQELILPAQITEYLQKLAEVTDMEILSGPYVYSAHELGYGGWVHWRTSGCSVYSYPATGSSPPLVTVDCYTCKPFIPEAAANFTKQFFESKELVWKEIFV